MASSVPIAPSGSSGVRDDEEWDTIVVGSGIGGMAVASLLAQCSEHNRVLILEQHPYSAGGCCGAFERDGYRFGVGVHFVGDMDEGSEMKKMMDALCLGDDPIVWTEMQYMTTTLIGKEELKVYSSPHPSAQALSELFPNEKDKIEKFIALCKEAQRCFFRATIFKCLPKGISSFLVTTGIDRLLNPKYRKFSSTTVDEVFRSLNITDPDLKVFLSGFSGCYGMPPKDAPFIMHSLGFGSEASPKFFYPFGGPKMIPEKIIRSIETNGGEVRLNSEVSKVIIEGGRAVGVRLKDGKTLRAKNQVISDAGFAKTFHDFVPEELQPSRRLRNAAKDESLTNGMTGIVLYVGLKGDFDEDYHLPATLEVTGPLSSVLPDTLGGLAALDAGDLTLYITCPSAKDGSWKTQCPGKTTLEILLMHVPWNAFQGLVDEDGNVKEEKKEVYEEFKRSFGQLMWTRTRQALIKVGAAEDKLPQVLADAAVAEVGTPLTYRRFLGSAGGAWYGLQHNRERFKPRNYYVLLRPESGIDGLYLTGEDVATDGVAGALLGGYLCAAKILKLRSPFDVVEKVAAGKKARST